MDDVLWHSCPILWWYSAKCWPNQYELSIENLSMRLGSGIPILHVPLKFLKREGIFDDVLSYFCHRFWRWQSQILNRELVSNFPMKEKDPLGYRTNLDHWQVAQQFAVQNLTLPSSMLVAKVTEYVYRVFFILAYLWN